MALTSWRIAAFFRGLISHVVLWSSIHEVRFSKAKFIVTNVEHIAVDWKMAMVNEKCQPVSNECPVLDFNLAVAPSVLLSCPIVAIANPCVVRVGLILKRAVFVKPPIEILQNTRGYLDWLVISEYTWLSWIHSDIWIELDAVFLTKRNAASPFRHRRLNVSSGVVN